jgi:CRP-like cAMP-binding protein
MISDMKAFENYLKQFPDYQNGILETLQPHLTSKDLKEGAYFVHYGSVCRHIAFVEQGLLRVFYFSNGREITNCFCREGAITTSYSSFSTQKVSEIAIQALEDCRLIMISKSSLQQLYEKDVFWQQVGRIAAENELVAIECHHRFLQDYTATERYLQVLKDDKELLQRVPLQYLASYLQVAPETLSRIRNKINRN